jgi:hypothetical protein
VGGLSEFQRLVIEHLQNLHNIFADVQRHRQMISGIESGWGRNGVKKFGFVWRGCRNVAANVIHQQDVKLALE